MNWEVQILNTIGSHPNIICLKKSFYSLVEAKIIGESANENQTKAAINSDKKYLYLVTEFTPSTFNKYNQSSRNEFFGNVYHPVRLL